MVRTQVVIILAVVFLPALLANYSDCAAANYSIDGAIGYPRGFMDWSVNGAWTADLERWVWIQPKITCQETYSWKRDKESNGSLFMSDFSLCLLASRDFRLFSSPFSLTLATGPGGHILNSYSSPESALGSQTKTVASLKVHLFLSLDYSIGKNKNLSLSGRGTWPTDHFIDTGYLTISHKMAAQKTSTKSIFPRTAIINRFSFQYDINNDDFQLKDTEKNSTLSVDLILTRRISSYYSLGIGLGAAHYSNVFLIPIFIDSRVYTKPESGLFAVVDIGASLGKLESAKDHLNDGFANGPMGYLGVGTRIPYCRSNAIEIEAGYRIQRSANYKYYQLNGSNATYEYNIVKHNYSMACLSLEFHFE